MKTQVKLVFRRRMGEYLLETIQGAVVINLSALRMGPFRAGDLVQEGDVQVLSQHYQVTVRA